MFDIIKNKTLKQFIKFGIIGATSTVIDFGILNLLVIYGHFNVYLAATISFLVAVTNGFVWNSRFTFKVKRGEDFEQGTSIRYISYVLVNVVGLGLNLGIMYIFIDYFHIWYNYAKLIAVFIVMFWNYGASRKWVFV